MQRRQHRARSGRPRGSRMVRRTSSAPASSVKGWVERSSAAALEVEAACASSSRAAEAPIAALGEAAAGEQSAPSRRGALRRARDQRHEPRRAARPAPARAARASCRAHIRRAARRRARPVAPAPARARAPARASARRPARTSRSRRCSRASSQAPSACERACGEGAHQILRQRERGAAQPAQQRELARPSGCRRRAAPRPPRPGRRARSEVSSRGAGPRASRAARRAAAGAAAGSIRLLVPAEQADRLVEMAQLRDLRCAAPSSASCVALRRRAWACADRAARWAISTAAMPPCWATLTTCFCDTRQRMPSPFVGRREAHHRIERLVVDAAVRRRSPGTRGPAARVAACTTQECSGSSACADRVVEQRFPLGLRRRARRCMTPSPP